MFRHVCCNKDLVMGHFTWESLVWDCLAHVPGTLQSVLSGGVELTAILCCNSVDRHGSIVGVKSRKILRPMIAIKPTSGRGGRNMDHPTNLCKFNVSSSQPPLCDTQMGEITTLKLFQAGWIELTQTIP